MVAELALQLEGENARQDGLLVSSEQAWSMGLVGVFRGEMLIQLSTQGVEQLYGV